MPGELKDPIRISFFSFGLCRCSLELHPWYTSQLRIRAHVQLHRRTSEFIVGDHVCSTCTTVHVPVLWIQCEVNGIGHETRLEWDVIGHFPAFFTMLLYKSRDNAIRSTKNMYTNMNVNTAVSTQYKLHFERYVYM